ncbi:uncharacterized protein BO80DRAFT_459402 [Aspergillus ibericus CBS 121593]|uniref:Mid2 domain-containing protein n=1 Tax=Aspergillus ibericus CBS 121593 TaxID=1448316 RepID=A0A395GK79_9EURO|nr:hypothetical protein BO80DRAFT_459402 [Aspergillus ibericus CBS 121593]RAK95891.1 hypothetical protein BO80DRAFT_459402 [Aspergillus ibericus CBS 121593]
MTPCYALHNAVAGRAPMLNPVDVPCGITNATHPYVTCCVRGDYCMSHGICHYINPQGQNGYYAADCTDPKMQDPACMTRCGGNLLSDLTYDATSGLWACCSYKSDGTKDCENHTQELFPAPAPSDLVTLLHIPTIGTPTYATSVAATSIASSSSEASDSRGRHRSIDAGAAAGIGVGVAAAMILIAMSIAFLILRRRVSSLSRAPRPGSFSSTTPAMAQVGPDRTLTTY